jgi:predicted metal-binding protein
MDHINDLEGLIVQHGYADFKWIKPENIVVSQWVRMKYMYGCPGKRTEYKSAKLARPSPESLAVDVYSTVRQCGFPIQVLTNYSQTMNRYAFLLLE